MFASKRSDDREGIHRPRRGLLRLGAALGAVALSFAVSGCGQKGSLFRPEKVEAEVDEKTETAKRARRRASE